MHAPFQVQLVLKKKKNLKTYKFVYDEYYKYMCINKQNFAS